MRKVKANQILTVFLRKPVENFKCKKNEDNHQLRSERNCKNHFLTDTFCMHFSFAVVKTVNDNEINREVEIRK